MKKLFLFVIISLVFYSLVPVSHASLISDKTYRIQQKKEYKQELKQIKELLKLQDKYANSHDLENLKSIYADNFIDNDGFVKEVYFKNIAQTWEECDDVTYTTKILNVSIDGDNASVSVEEIASGTLFDTLDSKPVAGELHSKSSGIYHLIRINGKWLISGETSISDEASLLYGDARFMNIEMQAPQQVGAGEVYTATVKVDADENTFIIGSIDHDPIVYPTNTPPNKLRAFPQSQILERNITANTDNLNEYALASFAISKIKGINEDNFRLYMAGLACVMRRINVVPKNNFVKLEEEDKDEHNGL